MELKSTISDTWKLCTFGSLVVFFLLLLFINHSYNVSISNARNSMVELAPFGQFDHGPQTTMIKYSGFKPKLKASHSVTNPPSNMTKGSKPKHGSEPEPELKHEPSNSTIDTLATMIKDSLTFESKHEPESKSKTEHEPEHECKSTTIHEPEPTPANLTIGHPMKKGNLVTNPIEKPINKTSKKCNIFDGRWVYKEEEVPSYNEKVCPFLEEKMSCRKNGRPDFEYEKWRWEANDCDIPLFSGRDMLERLRNKRVIVVGDSLNRNQWESLACLIYSSIHPSRAIVDAQGSAYKVLKAKDYNFKLEFYWSPFLIERDESHKSGRKVLVLDKLSSSSKQWRGADVMVFNSGHWWTHHHGKMKAWDMFEYEGQLVQEMPIELAYERAMKTWAKWVQINVNPKKTTVFFRSISAEHKGEQWCYKSTQPIVDESYVSLYPKSLIGIIERLIEEMNVKTRVVKYLNITKLSGYRQDAHPSVYRSWRWKIYTEKYKRLIQSYADCSHWCLPGLPDTWNRLLYTSLFFDTQDDMSIL